jgi:hypothetical protein
VSPPAGFPKLPEDLSAPARGGREPHGRDQGDQDLDSITVQFRKPRVTPQPEPGAPKSAGWNQAQEGRAASALPLGDYLSKLDRGGDAQFGGRPAAQQPPLWKAPAAPPRPGASEPTVVAPLRPPEPPRQGQPAAAPPSPPPAGGKGGQGGIRTRDVVILVSVIVVVLLVAVGAVLFLFLRGD